MLSILGSFTLQELYSSHQILFEEAKKFAGIPPKLVPPNGVLYVRQKEDVVTYAVIYKLKNFCCLSF